MFLGCPRLQPSTSAELIFPSKEKTPKRPPQDAEVIEIIELGIGEYVTLSGSGRRRPQQRIRRRLHCYGRIDGTRFFKKNSNIGEGQSLVMQHEYIIDFW